MKTLLLLLTFVLSHFAFAQNVGINETGASPHPSAILHVESESNTKGFLMPRHTTAQRDAILNPEHGLLIYNMETNCVDVFDGTDWVDCVPVGPPNQPQEKPRMLGYGGGVGTSSRAVPMNAYQDIDVRVICRQKDLYVELVDRNLQYRDISLDWYDASSITSSVTLNGHLYVLIRRTGVSPEERRVYRYDVNNIALGGTQMNFVGLGMPEGNFEVMMTSDGNSVFCFTHNSGNSPNDFQIAQYTLNGLNFEYIGSVACGNTPGSFDRVMKDVSGNIYGISVVTDIVMKFDPSGVLIYETPPYFLVNNPAGRVLNWSGAYYFGAYSVDFILNRVYLE